MEIRLHGYLKELHPAPIQVEASSVAEAVSFLQILPAFSPRSGKKHHVIIDGFHSRDAIYDTDLKPAVIDIRPVAEGAGRNGWAQIIIGVIMIVAAVYTGGTTLAGVNISAGSMMMAGGMMVLGGVLQLMAPQPEFNGPGSEERSRYLGQGRNTVAIGTRIPMIYGRRKWGGHYVSFNITAGDLNSAPASWYSSPFTNYGEDTYSAAPPEMPMPPVDIYDGQPQSKFTGLSYPDEMTSQPKTFINFEPLVDLSAGEWDINFTTGQTLHVMVESSGMKGKATLLGGEIKNLPPVGTHIIFTQNYV